MRSRRLLMSLLAVAGLAQLSCQRGRSPAVAAHDDYPPGRWRLVAPTELDGVVLWVSHILIRHRETDPSCPFNLVGWKAPEPAPARTREQARALALDIAREAQAAPASFGALARARSDDRITGEQGGSLGGIAAAHLIPWREVLDALAVLRPGEVSRVVETRFGFHVFSRGTPPPAERFAARRIVIGHDDAPFLEVARRGPRVHRTRAEALAIARLVAGEARGGRAPFERLVAAYSEHVDAAQGGDLGLWTSREPTGIPRERELLLRARVGEVLDPVDTIFGYVVLQRTDAAEREQFAMQAVRIPFVPGEPSSHPGSEQNMRALAAAIARQVRKHSSLLPSLQEKYGSERTERWSRGRGPFGVAAVVERLAIGEVAKQPVKFLHSYLIVQRVVPLDGAAVDPRFELPAPPRPDVPFFVEHGGAEWLSALFARAAENAGPVLAGPGDGPQKFSRARADFLATISHSDEPRHRRQSFDRLLNEGRAALGARGLAAYLSRLEDELEAFILRES
jgi:hypothetical protein